MEPEDIEKTVKAASVIVEADLTKDLLGPAAKQVGKGLGTIASTLNVALAPVAAFVWSFEKIAGMLEEELGGKFEKWRSSGKEFNIQTPDATIAVPALEALRYSAGKEDLRKMYVNLLATAMTVETAGQAHPSFVDAIRQLTPDEAKIINYLSKNREHATIRVVAKKEGQTGYQIVYRHFSDIGQVAACSENTIAQYLDNLQRLGIIEVTYTERLTDEQEYSTLFDHVDLKTLETTVAKAGLKIEKRKGMLRLTDFGGQFCSACVLED